MPVRLKQRGSTWGNNHLHSGVGISPGKMVLWLHLTGVRVGVPITRPEILTDTDSRTPRLRWSRVYTSPYDSVDVPLRYRIEVQDLPRRSWRPLAQGLDMEEYSMKDLTPDRDYMFRIRAETPEGDLSEPTHPIPYYRTRESSSYERSPVPEYKHREQDYSVPSRSYVDHLTTFIPPRLPIDKPELYEAGPDSATLSWKPAKVPERIRNKTSLTYSIDVRTPPNHEWRELVSGLTSTTYTLTNLHPRLDYMFRVKAHNEYGCSEASLPASLFRPIEIEDEEFEYEDEDWDDEYRGSLSETETPIDEAPPKIPMETPKITDHGETALLHWHEARIPVYAKKTPITYLIEIKEPPIPGWSRLASGISDTNYFIENLLPNRDYQFRVRAETQFGVSDPTLPAVLDRTKEQVKESIEEYDYTIEDFVIEGSRKMEEQRRQSIVESESAGYYKLKQMLSSVQPGGPSQMSSKSQSNHYRASDSGTYSRVSQPFRLPSDDDESDDDNNIERSQRYRRSKKSYQSSSESYSRLRRTRNGYGTSERGSSIGDYETSVKSLYDSNRSRIDKAYELLREDVPSSRRLYTSSFDRKSSSYAPSDDDRYGLRKSFATLEQSSSLSHRTRSSLDEVGISVGKTGTPHSEEQQVQRSSASIDSEIGSYSPLLRKAKTSATSELKSSQKDNIDSKVKSQPYTYLLSSSDEEEDTKEYKSSTGICTSGYSSVGVKSDIYSDRSEHFTYLLSSDDNDNGAEARQQKLKIEQERKLTEQKLKHLAEMLSSDSDENESVETRIRQKSKMTKYSSFSESKATASVQQGRQLDTTKQSLTTAMTMAEMQHDESKMTASAETGCGNEMDGKDCETDKASTDAFCEDGTRCCGNEMDEEGCKSEKASTDAFCEDGTRCCGDEMDEKVCESEKASTDTFCEDETRCCANEMDEKSCESEKSSKDAFCEDGTHCENVNGGSYCCETEITVFGEGCGIDQRVSCNASKQTSKNECCEIETDGKLSCKMEQKEVLEDDLKKEAIVSTVYESGSTLVTSTTTTENFTDFLSSEHKIGSNFSTNFEKQNSSVSTNGNKKLYAGKSKKFSYLLSSSSEDEEQDLTASRRPSAFDQYSHLLYSDEEEGLTSKGRKENCPYRSFLQDKARYEQISRSQTEARSSGYSESSEMSTSSQRKKQSIRKLSSKQSTFSKVGASKQRAHTQNGNSNLADSTDKTRRPSLDKKSDLDLPPTAYLESLVTGVPPRMSSSRPLITNQVGSHLTLSWLPGRVPSYVKGSHMRYVVEVRQPPSYQWNTLVDDLEENEFDVYDLLPDQDYMFRVRARNEFGMSDPTMPASVIRNRDDYTSPTHMSRSGSRDSLGSPWMRSRASSADSITKQWSFDEDFDVHPIRNAAPEFKPSDDTFFGAQSRPLRIDLHVRGFPLPTIVWYHKGKKLGKRYKSHIAPSGHVSLDLPEVTEDSTGEYKCCAENEEGVAVRKITLELADPPTFLEPMKDIVIDMRGRGKFECRVDGIPSPTIKWMKDWRPLAESSRIHVRHVAPDYWCLELDAAIGLDAGMYTCVAENPAGKAVSSAQLTVEDRPPKPMGLHFRQSHIEDYYYILEELGRGRHGVVRRVIDKSSGREFAAKFIPVSDPKHKYFFRQELENLRGVSHKNVLEVTDAFQSNWGLVIVSELVNGGELLERVISMENWTESDVARYIHQVLGAIKHLHGTGVLHLDIKPANIHLNSSVSDEIKLIDFGLSRRLYPDMVIKHNYGTPDFTSPEQINNDPLAHAADIWSTGTLAYLLLSGISPFHKESDRETLKCIQSCDWQFDEEAFKSVSKEAKDFITKLLVLEPSERLTIDECLEHPWIKNSATRGQGASLSLEKLRTFHDNELKQRRQGYLHRCARIQSLKSILSGDSEPDTVLQPVRDNTTGNLTFPDSEMYGRFLDEESWADWQTRHCQGLDTVLAPLTDADYTSRVKGYKNTSLKEGESSDADEMMKERCDLIDLEKEFVTFDPNLEIEAEWLLVAKEFKQQMSSKDLFPKDEDTTVGPLFISKLQNQTYMPGDTITLNCQVMGANTNVSWYRNEEPVSDGSRLRTTFSEDGKAMLTIQSSKPYDEGLYKCVARNRDGRSTTWARVTVGGVSDPPGRPAVTELSSSEALIVWEPPVSKGNANILGYRVDYRLTGRERWQMAAYVIDECCLVSNLLPGSCYRFRVCCYNHYGYSPYSVASHEVKTLSSGGSIELDNYTLALLARQRDVDRHPTPPSSRKGSEPSPQEVTILESSPDSTYEVLNSVYSGGFADLKCCKMLDSSALYLAKIIPVTAGDPVTQRREYDILRTMCHERIVGLYGAYLYQEHLYLILEFLYGLNVAQHFAYKTRYTEDNVAYVIRQILDGVEYLHYNGVTHLNLQPSSVIMVSRRRSDIKIVDFSLARLLPTMGELVPKDGHPEFMAPEVVTGEKTTRAADIWTVGTLTFILLSGVSPFEGDTEEDVFANIAYNRYYAHSLYENVTREALKFVFQVLKRTPRKRLTASQCLEDKWLQATDIMTKTREERVFTTVSLRSFTRRYFRKRVLQMYPVIEEEVASSVGTEDMEEDQEEPSMDVSMETEEPSQAEEPIKSEDTSEQGDTHLEQMASNLVTTAIDAALQSPDIKSA